MGTPCRIRGVLPDTLERDYKELFNRYKDTPGVVFLVDPPYLSTDVGTYNMSWRMSDYLDVLNVLSLSLIHI